MKVVITKEEFEKLDDLFKAEYKEADGAYVLNADGIDNHPDVKALKGAYEAVKDKKSDAAKQLEKLQAKIDADKKAAEEADLLAQKNYDELAKRKEEEAANSAAELAKLKEEILNGKIDSEAMKIATAINPKDATRQKFLAGEARKYVQNTDNGLALLNSDGTPTDQKTVIANLTKEFPFLASGNPAGGGGAPGNPTHQEHTEPPKTAGEAIKAAFSGVKSE